MAKHSKTGLKGEQIAADFLLKKGYIILFKNWRAGKKEIDIIAVKDDMAIIVEVKTRSAQKFSFPEEAVNAQKKQHLRAAADTFMELFPQHKHIRFDIISILMNKGDVLEIIHFEEAFH